MAPMLWLGALLAFAGAPAGDALAPDDTGVPLEFRAPRAWEIELPAASLAPVGQGFAFAATLGRDFAAEPSGTALRIDTDGDGVLDVTVDAPEGHVTLFGTEGRRYAVRLIERQGWRYAPGGFARGELLGSPVRIIDANLDGDYGDIGQDAMIIGRGEIAIPLSAVISAGGALHEVTVAADGTRLSHRPYTGATGTLRLGPCRTAAKVLSAVVRSADGRMSFDVARAQEGIVVPAGSYRLDRGAIGLGENRVAMATGRSESFEVAAGGTREVAWGGPVKAEFAYQHSGGQVNLSPDKVWYFGAAGEEYVGWTPLGKSPQFTIRDKKSGRELAQAYFPGTC